MVYRADQETDEQIELFAAYDEFRILSAAYDKKLSRARRRRGHAAAQVFNESRASTPLCRSLNLSVLVC